MIGILFVWLTDEARPVLSLSVNAALVEDDRNIKTRSSGHMTFCNCLMCIPVAMVVFVIEPIGPLAISESLI